MKFFFISFLFTVTFLAGAQSGKKILFIGNSYTYVNDLPGMLQQIALSLGDTVFKDSNAPGGYTFQMHSTDAVTFSKINAQDWDYVILQAQSQEPAFDPAQVAVDTYPYADSLAKFVYENDSCTNILFYMTWGRKNGDAANCPFYPVICTYEGMQYRLRQSYLEMAQNNNAQVSPVGVAWRTIRQTDTTIELYQPDESHPSLAGTYVAACTFYCSIFHKSLIGAHIPAGLDTADALYIQQISQSTVFDSLSIWHIDTSAVPCNYVSILSKPEKTTLIRIWPNPATNELNVHTELTKQPYTIFDNTGRVISSGILYEGNNRLMLDTFANGNYVLSININRAKQNYKISIIK